MDVETLKKEIQKLVDDMLAQKDFAGIGKDVEVTLKKAEETLNDMIARLTDAETKSADAEKIIDTLKSEKEAVSAEAASLKEELDKVNIEKSTISARLAEIENTLKEIEENKRLETRVVELSSLKIARTGDAFEAQKNVVKKMTDEEYTSYRDELVALRADLIKDVEVASVAPASSTAVEDVKPEDIVAVPPPVVNIEQATIVAPVSTNNTLNRVKEFGNTFSKYMNERNKKAPKSK